MRRRLIILIAVAMLDHFESANLTHSSTAELKGPEHAAAGKKVVEVSVISNKTSGGENKTDDAKERETTTSKALENIENETDNNKDLNKSEALEPIIHTENSEQSIDFDYDKFMKELKSSHQKLAELNKALQNRNF